MPRSLDRPFFSLIHATFNSSLGLHNHYARWISRCDFPEDVEYIFAMDRKDLNSCEAPDGFKVILTNTDRDLSSSVTNWNAAALSSVGRVIVAVSDDLEPCNHWDSRIRELIIDREPSSESFVLKIKDSDDETNSLVSHPIVSRAYYQKLGLFDPEFASMYCDNDFTWRAFFRSTIFDAREIEFTHLHPHLGNYPESVSHQRNNRPVEYRHGESVFKGKWPFFIDASEARRLPLTPPTRQTAYTPWHTIAKVLFSTFSRGVWRATKNFFDKLRLI